MNEKQVPVNTGPGQCADRFSRPTLGRRKTECVDTAPCQPILLFETRKTHAFAVPSALDVPAILRSRVVDILLPCTVLSVLPLRASLELESMLPKLRVPSWLSVPSGPASKRRLPRIEESCSSCSPSPPCNTSRTGALRACRTSCLSASDNPFHVLTNRRVVMILDKI
jgi:hypothetical protein